MMLTMVVDLAHAGPRTAREAIEFTRGVPVITHANARGLRDHPRNVPDDVLAALAERGGVVGVTAYPPFWRKMPASLRDGVSITLESVLISSKANRGSATERFFRRRHPAIVGNYTMDTIYAEGFGRVDELVALLPALLRRRFAEDEVAKVLGENFLRVFARVWDGIDDSDNVLGCRAG